MRDNLWVAEPARRAVLQPESDNATRATPEAADYE